MLASLGLRICVWVHRLFKHLDVQQRDAIADAMEERTFETGDVIIQEGSFSRADARRCLP